MKILIPISILILVSLQGCSLIVGGIVGAALTPLIQPQADRLLYTLGLDFIDPDGTDKVKQYDHKENGK